MPRPSSILLRSVALSVLVTGMAGSVRAQTGENILVVANATSDASQEIADYYAKVRQVPDGQVLRLTMPGTEEIARSAYEAQIELPIADWLRSHSAQDRILYIVLTKGVPLRIAGSIGAEGTVASVDSELTLLYRKLTGFTISPAGPIKNPYFLADAPVGNAQRFSHKNQDIYLVSRLDGYTVDDVKGLIDRGRAPSNQGIVLLDERGELVKSPGNTWLDQASQNLKKLDGWADRVVLDPGIKVLRDQANLLGYYSWGSNDPAIQVRQLGLQFVPGALAAMFVSTDARTLQEPPPAWEIRKTNFKGTSQSLAGDLIRAGVTGVAGHVAEPFLKATIRPDMLFPSYASGFNLVELFYLAMPSLSWQTVVIGDPLCSPFKGPALAAHDADPGIADGTELPTFFSARRVATLVASGAKPDAARLIAHADFLTTKGDRVGARDALERATSLDESYLPAQQSLAATYELLTEWDAAIDRYRRIVDQAPNNAIALNNLAYALAIRRKAPAEALPFAKRAYVASKGSPLVADTLGWVYHLLGSDGEAEPLVVAAARTSGNNAEILLHAAVVLAAAGKGQPASEALKRALEIDRSLANSDDAIKVRDQLGLPKQE